MHLLGGKYALPPLHYYFELTRRCNLRCEMCQYINWLRATPGKEQGEGELNTGEWSDLIDQTNPLSIITFTGGEPWVRTDFMELLERASAKRRTHFITNGIQLTEERARRCVELAPKRMGGRGLNSIGVSLEGPAELHDGIVNLEGAFERATAGLRALTKYKRELGKAAPMVHVTVVVQNANLHILPDMARIVADTGAEILNLSMEIRFYDLKDLGKVHPESFKKQDVPLPKIEAAELDEALNLTRQAADERGIELRMPRMPQKQVVEYYQDGMRLKDYRCLGPWTQLFVSAKGNAGTCLIHSVGNVRDHSLRALWKSLDMKRFRTRIRKGVFPVCQGCCMIEHKDKL